MKTMRGGGGKRKRHHEEAIITDELGGDERRSRLVARPSPPPAMCLTMSSPTQIFLIAACLLLARFQHPPPPGHACQQPAPEVAPLLPYCAATPAPSSLANAASPRQPETLTSRLPPTLIHHPTRRRRPRHRLVPPLASTTTSHSRCAPPTLPLGRPTTEAGRAGAPGVGRALGRQSWCILIVNLDLIAC
jgi:hypothetical protein